MDKESPELKCNLKNTKIFKITWYFGNCKCLGRWYEFQGRKSDVQKIYIKYMKMDMHFFIFLNQFNLEPWPPCSFLSFPYASSRALQSFLHKAKAPERFLQALSISNHSSLVTTKLSKSRPHAPFRSRGSGITCPTGISNEGGYHAFLN